LTWWSTSFEIFLSLFSQALDFLDELRIFFANVAQKKLSKKIFQGVYPHSLLWKSIPWRILKKGFLVEIPLFKGYAPQNVLCRSVLHQKPSMLQTLYGVLCNLQDLELSVYLSKRKSDFYLPLSHPRAEEHHIS
jgi:hypothetical protein